MKNILVTDFERQIINHLLGRASPISKASLTHLHYIVARIDKRAEQVEERIYVPPMTHDSANIDL
jgi:hypothetical protein